MPALFAQGAYDLAGYNVGVLEFGHELKEDLKEGDVIVGLPSSGMHCGGFDVIYEVMERLSKSYNDVAPFSDSGRTFGEKFPNKFSGKSFLKQCFKISLQRKSFSNRRVYTFNMYFL